MTDTSGIEYTTFFDQRPTHRVEPDWLAQARKRVDLAIKAYDAHVESVLAGNGTPWEPLLTELADKCAQAERELKACQQLDAEQQDYRETVRDTASWARGG